MSEDCYLISGLEPAGQVTWRSWIGIIEETDLRTGGGVVTQSRDLLSPNRDYSEELHVRV